MTTNPEEAAEFIATADRLHDPAAPVPFDRAVRWWNLGWIDLKRHVDGRDFWFITALGQQLICAQTDAQKAAAIIAADEAIRAWLRCAAPADGNSSQ